ncbi:Sporulation and spore germination [Fusobacterium necrogenes]|uniref:Sporulation and spore germination n=1 Tax=Fusobacterium necrogenes TaxID=858 RepID=A0A377GUR7_9FUSO|nr:GerMN domain-containing protein [Fusobacterium necrogenes]STO30720.1 Sporulation and spore germination [Fusobacterium necrogenes]
MVLNRKLLFLVGIIWGIAIISAVGYFQLKKSSEKINIIQLEKKENVIEDEGRTEKIKFYFLGEDRKSLISREEDIPLYSRTKDKVRKITEKSLENLWNVKVLKNSQIEIGNIFIIGDMIYIDIDANILELKPENRINLLSIYSIVNSITEVDGIRRVKFLIDGKEETGSFSKIYTRNTNI